MLICQSENQTLHKLQEALVIQGALEENVVLEWASRHHGDKSRNRLDRSYSYLLFLVHVDALSKKFGNIAQLVTSQVKRIGMLDVVSGRQGLKFDRGGIVAGILWEKFYDFLYHHHKLVSEFNMVLPLSGRRLVAADLSRLDTIKPCTPGLVQDLKGNFSDFAVCIKLVDSCNSWFGVWVCCSAHHCFGFFVILWHRKIWLNIVSLFQILLDDCVQKVESDSLENFRVCIFDFLQSTNLLAESFQEGVNKIFLINVHNVF